MPLMYKVLFLSAFVPGTDLNYDKWEQPYVGTAGKVSKRATCKRDKGRKQVASLSMTFAGMVSQPVQSRRKGRDGTQICHKECTSKLLYKITGLRLSDF